jgi:hypothetical protein
MPPQQHALFVVRNKIMNLIENIIGELTDSSKSLTDPLLKTKVLASRIKNDELLSWVDNELTGYKNKDIGLPDYRHGRPTFICTLKQGWGIEENIPLPLMIFSKEARERLFIFQFDDSVKTLEAQAGGEAGDMIYKDFGADMCSFLTSQIVNNNQLGIRILKLRVVVQISEITQALAVIRSTLLDFMLKVESEFPNLDDLIKEKLIMKEEYKNKMDKIVHQTIINAGDGNTITTGNSNKVSTKYKILKGNLDSLKQELKKNNVADEDIAEITTIVQEERPNIETGEFGLKTNKWLHKMYQKSIDGTWEVGIATAGGLLVEILKGFFGL